MTETDPISELTNYEVWKSRKNWPADVGRKMFLPRAFIMVGESLYDQSWLPLSAPNSQLHRVRDLMIDWLADNKLPFWTLREYSGEGFQDKLTSAFWTDPFAKTLFFHAFVTSDFLPDEPIRFHEDEAWIFLDADALETLLIEHAYKIAGVNHLLSTEAFVPSYIRLMLAVCRDLGINLENQPKKSVVEERLFEMQGKNGFPTMSRRLIGFASTLIREEEMQQGRASDRYRKGKG